MDKVALILEDEYLIAMDLKAMLVRHGWRVMGPVATVREALSLLADETPSVAVLDVDLGDEPSTRVAETLRARAVPFVVASAYAQPERFGGEVLVGAPNIGKPVTEKYLLATLEELTKTR